MKASFLITLFFLLYGSILVASEYGYPIKNPLAATIVGTPDLLKASQESLTFWQPDYVDIAPVDSQFDKEIDNEYKISIFPEREISDLFWHERGGLKYSVAQHNAQAPLIFIISGTGSSYRSSLVKELQKNFYQAGFHVVAISSPTVPNFMLNASRSVIPGNMYEDSADIHHAMQQIINKHRDIQVSDFYLTGYSLGASHAVYVTKFDDEKQGERFQFKKVLLINPPVSLINSVVILDKMFEDNIPGGLNNFNVYYKEIIHKVSEFHHQNEDLGLGKEFFFEMFRKQQPSDQAMKAIIGFVFRVASSGMVFTADVYNHQGYVIAKDKVSALTASSSLTKYSKVAFRLGFDDYIENFYLPNFVGKSGLTQKKLLKEASLESIAPYLQQNSRISVMHNLDDPILMPGEIDQIKALFPGRIMLYPHGGHLGNVSYQQNTYDMLEFFTGKKMTAMVNPANKGAIK